MLVSPAGWQRLRDACFWGVRRPASRHVKNGAAKSNKRERYAMKTLAIVKSALVLCLLVAAPATAQTVWHVPTDFATIQDAINDGSVVNGDTILVEPGNHTGALVTKGVEIKGTGGAVIDSGPPHPSTLSQGFRLLAGSAGASISHLTFTTDLSIMNGDAIDDVTVTQNTFLNSIQAVSNWRGSRWQISHNNIQDLRAKCGGGIGILIADLSGGSVEDNVVSHNTISGNITFPDGDCGGYDGTGIVIYADFRWGRTGAANISYNRVVKNKISVAVQKLGSTTNPVGAVAFELTDTRNDSNLAILFDNKIGFNDFRGSDTHVTLTPSNLDQSNEISRNFGENRGQGSHPNLFGPGGN